VLSTNVKGLTIAYHRAGMGPPLVLLHGFIIDSRTWRRQTEALPREFDVIAWDAPGCGQSSDPDEEFSMAEFANCLAGLLDNIDVRTAHFCGLSWGGTAALEFYRLYPERVRSLILADAYAGWTGSLGKEAAAQRLARCLRESEMPPAEWVPQWAPGAFSGGAPQELVDEMAAIMWDFHPVGFRAMSRSVEPDFRDILPQVRVPTLLIWGDDDKRSPLSCGEAMRDSIPGSRLLVIRSAGHLSNMEQPELFNAAVRDFLRSVEAGG
jgi:pimeloyl-ACP methyl ester carboxylesterase